MIRLYKAIKQSLNWWHQTPRTPREETQIVWVCSLRPHTPLKEWSLAAGKRPHGSRSLSGLGKLWVSVAFSAHSSVSSSYGVSGSGTLALMQVPTITTTTTVHGAFQCYPSTGPSGSGPLEEGWIASQRHLSIHPAMSATQQAAAPPKAWLSLRDSSYFPGKQMDFT